jgi:hypothetical protein
MINPSTDEGAFFTLLSNIPAPAAIAIKVRDKEMIRREDRNGQID